MQIPRYSVEYKKSPNHDTEDGRGPELSAFLKKADLNAGIGQGSNTREQKQIYSRSKSTHQIYLSPDAGSSDRRRIPRD